MVRAFLCGILAFLLSQIANALPVVMLYPFEFEGKQFTIATIRQDPTWTHWQDETEFAKFLLEEAQKWTIEQYRSRYPKLPSEFFEKVFEHSPLFDEHSSYVLIFEGRDIREMRATIRFAWPNKDGLLPSETLFGHQAPRDGEKFDLFPEGRQFLASSIRRDNLKGIAPFIPNQTQPTKAGGVAEIKNFAATPSLEADLIPLLFFVSEHSGVSQDGGGPNTSSYVIYCDRSMVNYYRQWGFKLLEDKPIAGENYAMTMSRKDYQAQIEKRIRGRPGFGLLLKGLSDLSVAGEYHLIVQNERFPNLKAYFTGGRCLGHFLRRLVEGAK